MAGTERILVRNYDMDAEFVIEVRKNLPRYNISVSAQRANQTIGFVDRFVIAFALRQLEAEFGFMHSHSHNWRVRLYARPVRILPDHPAADLISR